MKRGIMLCVALVSAFAFAGAVRSDELTSESDQIDSTGWAVSSFSGRVFKVESGEDKDVLKAALVECKRATKELCEGIMTASPDTVVVALHCRRNSDARQDESFLGASLIADEGEAVKNAMAKAAERSFNPDQDCNYFYSSAAKESEEKSE